MIQRQWCGWTSRGNAARYEALLLGEIFVSIRNRDINGLLDLQLLRREAEGEVEFLVVMSFDSIHSVSLFAGEDYEVAYVPDKARAFLSRFEERARHYELRKIEPDHLQ